MKESQIEEVEAIRSIFYDAGEFQFEDENDEFLFDEGSLDRDISFYINTDGFEIYFRFPAEYPETKPVTVRLIKSDNKSVDVEMTNRLLRSYAEDNKGDPVVLELIEYLKENSCTESVEVIKRPEIEETDEYVRYWVYSHHIRSMTKRKNILRYSNENNLSGFSKPGYPGIICLEGPRKDVDFTFKIIRGWNWRHIEVRISDVINKNDIKFPKPFAELPTTDLSDLNKLLISLGLGKIFTKLFNVKGTTPDLDLPDSFQKLKLDNLSDSDENETYSRLWIWTHHVYNGNKRDEKRRDVVKFATALGLNGFSLPGKPGVILIEGLSSICDDYWSDMKTWGWRDIEIRHEEKNLSIGDKRFFDFCELTDCMSASAVRNNAPDFSKFKEYLEGKGLEEVFQELFNF